MRIGSPKNLWLSWTVLGLLATLCMVLAALQSHWIAEISVAERDRLHGALQSGLARLSDEFDRKIADSCSAVTPSFSEINRLGTEQACAERFRLWKEKKDPLFRRIGIVKPNDATPRLFLMDFATNKVVPTQWPSDWRNLQNRFTARFTKGSNSRPISPESQILEFALYGSMHRLPQGEPPFRPREPYPEPPGAGPPPPLEDWLVLELNLDYLRSTVLPSLFDKYLAASGMPAYDAKVVPSADPSVTLMNLVSANTNEFHEADASVGLLETSRIQTSQRPIPPNRENEPPSQPPTTARWRLLVHHRGTSLDDLVAAARWRNIATSTSILMLILATVIALLHFSRRSQQLAELQMNFVAGVSHELRTPLTVIRTAAFNLRGKVATRPEQVEKYGQLIQTESEKLTTLVEQVLRYGTVKTGRVIGERRPITTEALLNESLRSSLVSSTTTNLVIDKQIPPGLPPLFADEVALKHALQNLLDNAVKYGLTGSNWIGIKAEAISEGNEHSVEVRIADKGPGIPAGEQAHLFDAFFRGKRALQDQIHGTGLGLNLVKSIVEAHGGSIRVVSEPFRGAEFIVRIPVALGEQ